MKTDEEVDLDYSLIDSDDDDNTMELAEEKKKGNNKESGRYGKRFTTAERCAKTKWYNVMLEPNLAYFASLEQARMRIKEMKNARGKEFPRFGKNNRG